MKKSIRHYRNVKDSGFNLTAEYNVQIEKVEKKYKDLLNKKFNKHKKIPFNEIASFTNVTKVLKGEICYMPSPDSSINIFITEKEYDTSGRYTILELENYLVSKNYLLWYLNLKEVKDYISCQGIGAIFTYIPKETFYKLSIPLPKSNLKYTTNKVQFTIGDSPFRKLLNQYYIEYQYNFKKGNYMTAAILAGAIAETFLHNYLIETGLDEKLFGNKTLGGLIDLVEVYIIEKNIESFPLTHFREIQGLRNSAVHPKLAKDKIEREEEFGISNFDCFNHIIKYFGL